MGENHIDKYIKLADENLKYSIKHQINNMKNVKMYETENYIIYSIGAESVDAHLNGALCLNDEYAEEMLKKADDFFRDLNLDYTVWVRDHADFNLEEMLKSRGIEPRRTPGSAVMVTEERITEAELPEGFKVKGVNNREDIEDFAKVVKEAFEKTDIEIEKMYETEETLVHDDIISYVIYKDDEPVSSVMTVISEDVAGIYWVGTAKSARGQGVGSYIAQIATNAGFDSGKNLVILQASEAGERIYEKLGYQTVTRYRTYVVKSK